MIAELKKVLPGSDSQQACELENITKPSLRLATPAIVSEVSPFKNDKRVQPIRKVQLA